jgi:hypothetical protein
MRIARAKEHIRNLDRRVKRFFDSKPYARITERDNDGINDLHKVKLTKPFPAGVVSVAAEAIEGLRSALDQTAFATAMLSGVKHSKSAYFPIANSAKELDRVMKGRCKDIPPDIASLFRTFNPYKGGNDLIWALNAACNTSKHGIVVPVGMAAAGMNINHMVMSGTGAIFAPVWNREKNEIVFASTTPDTELDYNIQFSFFVAFGEVDGIGGKPAIPVLNTIAGDVNRIVIAVEAEAKRIGLIR